jgi:hypothetical protein
LKRKRQKGSVPSDDSSDAEPTGLAELPGDDDDDFPLAPPIPAPNLIWVPFTEVDPHLLRFAADASEFTPGVPILFGAAPINRLPVAGNLLVLAHGQGLQLSNYEAHGPVGYVTIALDAFAASLATVLPGGFTGTITLWACNVARPFKHFPGGAPPGTGDQSFISRLHGQLPGVQPDQVRGAIGYITLGLGLRGAKVYPDKAQPFTGRLTPPEGIIHAGEVALDNFYLV